MKKVVVISDSFKGSLSSKRIGEIAKSAAKKIAFPYPLETYEIADGGEGSLSAIASEIPGEFVSVDTMDANLLPTQASYYLSKNTAYIEMASVTSLPKTKIKDPGITSTYGLGALFLSALHHGCQKIVVCLGGSSTNDAGIGLLESLGCRFYDKSQKQITAQCGNDLDKIASFDAQPIASLFGKIEVTAMCDVNNPLCGENGASIVYSPQKGASPEQAKMLDDKMRHFAKMVAKQTSRDNSNVDGAGAAGGLGFCLLSFFSAKLVPGINVLLEEIHFQEKIDPETWIITGEGRFDQQSLSGKVVSGIIHAANAKSAHVILLVGSAEEGLDGKTLTAKCVEQIYITSKARKDLEDALAHAEEDYEKAVICFLENIR